MGNKVMGPSKELQEFFAQGYPGPRTVNIKQIKKDSQININQSPKTLYDVDSDKKSVMPQ